MVLQKSRSSVKSTPIWPSVLRIVKLSGRGQGLLYVALATSAASAIVVVAMNHFMRRALDSVPSGNPARFWFYIAAVVGSMLIAMPLVYLRTRTMAGFSERTLASIRQAIAGIATGLPVRYLEDRHTGDLLSIVNADLAKVKKLTANDLLDLTRNLTFGVCALIYLIGISWQLTLVSTLLVPVMFWVVSKLTAAVAKRTEQMQEVIGQVNSIAQDGLSGLLITRAFNLARILDERFHQANQNAMWKGIGIAHRRAVVDTAGYVVNMLPFLITFGYGGYLVIVGQMTFGSIFAFVNLLNYVANPLTEIPNLLANIGEATGAAQRIFHLLDQQPERQEGIFRQPDLGTASVVRFDDVTFAYQAGTPILENFSFKIRKGEKVAIVGSSGSGKTTILKLLLGFYPVEQGSITAFGSDLHNWQLNALRQQMAFVAQDTYLFPVSIGENIRCGKISASQVEVEAAARAANIHDFILGLAETYDTLVGERGARLSGGERQRIALARAILKDAPLLLLDEATSALDSESEALVQEALERFMIGRTTIVIAHRLATIRNADRILVIDAGRILESGTHEQLFARAGLYRDLYVTQFIPDQTDQDEQVRESIPPVLQREEVTHA